MAKNNKRRTKKSKKAEVTPVEVGTEHKAPTSGLEDTFFGRGKDFRKVLNALAEHVGTGDHPGAKMAGYAMWEINNPNLVVPKKGDWLSAEACEKYWVEVEKHDHDVDTWEGNCTCIFHLTIQYCDPELHNLLRV